MSLFSNYSKEEQNLINFQPEDNEKMANNLAQAKKLVTNNIFRDMREEIKHFDNNQDNKQGEIIQEQFNKGSLKELLYKILIEELPNLNIVLDEDPLDEANKIQTEISRVTIKPTVGEEKLIAAIKNNPNFSQLDPLLGEEEIKKIIQQVIRQENIKQQLNKN